MKTKFLASIRLKCSMKMIFGFLFRDIIMEEEQRRMKSAVYDVLNDIDRKCLRTLQVNYL